jgi:flagella basal body P-ring formation protein FlgA
MKRTRPAGRLLLLGGLALWAIAPFGCGHEARSAELRLRAQCTVEGPLVRLGDVAEIVGGDPAENETLAATDLCPSPAGREQRSLGVRELQDLLVLRGVNLARCQFSGSSQVLVLGRSTTERPQAAPALPPGAVRRAQRRVCEAVVKYLDERASPRQAWVAETELSEDQARVLADSARTISVSGGKQPWTGAQHFEATIGGAQGPLRLALEVQVSVRAPVVMTVHSLARGAVIRDGDVELQQNAAADGAGGALASLEEAIGRETVRALPAGKVVSTDALRTPPWVRRGEVVTVYARTAGIQVRTAARSRDDGSQGDLVSVESLLDRSTFYARVSGMREVEVYARAPRVETVDAGGPQNVLRR